MTIDWNELAAPHPELVLLPASLRANARRLGFAVGDTLYRRGARPGNMLYVLTGEIRLVRPSATGDTIILQRGRHGFIAEASMEAAVYHCDIEAFEAGQLLAFPLDSFRQALDDDTEFHRAWIRRMALEIRRLRAQNERLHLHKAADRVLHYLASDGTDGIVKLNQSRKSWAAELGLSHEALYRTLRQMERDGRIKLSGSQIESAGPAAGG
jgi:CRP-like cAMP-binding protein